MTITKSKQIIGQNYNPSLDEFKESFETYKKPIRLKYRISDTDDTIKTKEGEVKCKEGDFILTGTEGELWPIKSEKFKSTYKQINKNFASKKKLIVYALQMKDIFRVKVNWSDDILEGKYNDYLIEYNKGDYGIVDELIFRKTYILKR